jgi:hypothetical protein
MKDRRLSRHTGSTLGDDVVVKGWRVRPRTGCASDDLPLIVDLTLDLGDRSVLRRGHRDPARRHGARDERSDRLPRQRLDPHGARHVLRVRPAAHDRARQLVFDGRLDNPGLDIVALRKNLAVEAGSPSPEP